MSLVFLHHLYFTGISVFCKRYSAYFAGILRFFSCLRTLPPNDGRKQCLQTEFLPFHKLILQKSPVLIRMLHLSGKAVHQVHNLFLREIFPQPLRHQQLLHQNRCRHSQLQLAVWIIIVHSSTKVTEHKVHHDLLPEKLHACAVCRKKSPAI